MRFASGIAYALMGLVLSLRAVAATPPASTPAPQYTEFGPSRTFAIIYSAKISEVPAGTRLLRIWLPVPSDSSVQTIHKLNFSRPAQFTHDRKYGNRIAYWEITSPAESDSITMTFTCTRREIRVDLARVARDGADQETQPEAQFAVFKKPDRLVVVNEPIRRLAAQITAGQRTTLEKAKAIYDYVLANMRYDKSGTGWGTGSTEYACAVGRGNCTDFHSLFNSLCRAEGIASEFEIGLYLPYERNASEPVGGYHCWASFRVPGRTWVPVDCSEAWREPARRDFFFGGHTNNRVTLSVGRDLTLEPEQAGEPLNYFVDPYGEADGKPVTAKKIWSYQDLN